MRIYRFITTISVGLLLGCSEEKQAPAASPAQVVEPKPQAKSKPAKETPIEATPSLADALKNKRLHYGVHGFETNCIQFNTDGTVRGIGSDESMETVISGRSIAFFDKDSMEGGFQFSRPAVEVGDKFMVVRGENLLKPYETYPVLVLKLEDLPSGGMANLITGKRIYYQPPGRAGWIQFNADGTAMDEYSHEKYMFWVDGLKISIPKRETTESAVTFHAQSLKAGDSITIFRDNKLHEVKITKVEPASKPDGLSKKKEEKEARARKMAPVINSAIKVDSMIDVLNALRSDDGRSITLPDANKWGDWLLSKKVSLELFLSPQLPQTPGLLAALKKGELKQRVSHYAFNKAVSGRKGEFLKQILIFECDLGWNGAGGIMDAIKYMESNGIERIVVGYGDGSVRNVTKEELDDLHWDANIPIGKMLIWAIGATNNDITKWKGRSTQDVLKQFGKPTTAKPHGEGGGIWTYRGMTVADGRGKIYKAVIFTVEKGVVQEVQVTAPRSTP
jgi:hypothetical protein